MFVSLHSITFSMESIVLKINHRLRKKMEVPRWQSRQCNQLVRPLKHNLSYIPGCHQFFPLPCMLVTIAFDAVQPAKPYSFFCGASSFESVLSLQKRLCSRAASWGCLHSATRDGICTELINRLLLKSAVPQGSAHNTY